MIARSYICLVVLTAVCMLVASTEPDVCAWIVTAVDDRKAGGEVEMRCLANDLQPHHVVEWSDRPPDEITYDHHLLTSSVQIGRYHFHTEQTGNTLTKYFSIRDLRAEDTARYFCNVCEITDGRKLLVSTSSVALSVLFFPSGPPVCFPAGPVTVDPGTVLTLSCSSDSGNSAVSMDVTQTPARCSRYTWTSCSINDTISASTLTLTVGLADDRTAFECNISSVYFPGERHSCTLGPIRVAGAPGASTEYTPAELPGETSSSSAAGSLTEPTTVVDQSKPDDDDSEDDDDAVAAAEYDKDDDEDDDASRDKDDAPARDSGTNPKTCPRPKKQPFPTAWLAATLVTLLLLVVSVIVNIFLLLRIYKPKPLNNNNLVARRRGPLGPDPPVELQEMEANVTRPKQPEENSYEDTEA